MLDQFLEYINKKEIFTPTDRVLLAVSGGIDSVLMCHLCAMANFDFAIAHCNFSLRGKTSDEEVFFVKKLAEDLGVDFYTTRFQTTEIAKLRKASIQVVARDLRYEYLERIRKEQGFDYIATAHHLSDSIETVFFNFGRGSGIKGLHGIAPKSGKIIRPMLFTTKSEIEKYAKENKLKWRQDASNESDKYSRNKIRHHVIPVFQSIYPNFEQKAGTTIEHLNEVEAIYDWSIHFFREQLLHIQDSNTIIDLEKLRSTPAPSTILYELIKAFQFHSKQVYQILQSTTGSLFYSLTHELLVDRNKLIIKQLDSNKVLSYKINTFDDTFYFEHTQLEFRTPKELPNLKNIPNDIAYLDKDKLQLPLVLRHWEAGDRFQPLGMKGKSKKLQDYFSDLKLDRFEKEKIWILASADEICWLVGHRLDERFKVTSSTKNILSIQVKTIQ